MWLAVFFVALIANAISAFSGGGAGLLQLPALLMMGYPFFIALSSHKVATVALGLGAAMRYQRQSILEWRMILLIIVGAPGVVLGAVAIINVDERISIFSLGVLTLGLGVYSVLKPSLGLTQEAQHRDLKGVIIGGSILLLIAIINGALSSGTGLFVTLWLVRWFGMDYRTAVIHTMLSVGIAWNGIGAISLVSLVSFDAQIVVPLVLGAFLGGVVGAQLAIRKGSSWVKKGFECITIISGIGLIVKAVI